MFRTNKFVFTLATFVVLGVAASAVKAETIITFDALASGTKVTDQFQSQGVLFSSNKTDGPLISESAAAASAPNILISTAETVQSIVTIKFVLPGTTTAGATDFVSFVVTDSQSGTGELFSAAAYDISGVLLQTFTGASNDEPLLSFNVMGIHRVEFSESGDLEGIDDLTFETPRAGAVPEPATMLLLGTGLAGVVTKVRRRSKAGRNNDSKAQTIIQHLPCRSG